MENILNFIIIHFFSFQDPKPIKPSKEKEPVEDEDDDDYSGSESLGSDGFHDEQDISFKEPNLVLKSPNNSRSPGRLTSPEQKVRSPSPSPPKVPTKVPTKVPIVPPPTRRTTRRAPSPLRKPPSPVPRSPSPVQRIPSPVQEKVPSPVQEKVPSPVPEKVPSPVQQRIPSPVQPRAPSPKISIPGPNLKSTDQNGDLSKTNNETKPQIRSYAR